MRIYDRSPDPNVTAVDAILQAELAMYVPYGNTPNLNGGDDLPGALFVSTNPADKHLYFKAEVGGAFIACATLVNGKVPTSQLNFKTTIPITTTVLTINWQTATPPSEIITYATKHGNSISNITGVYLQGGVYVSYNPAFSYTVNGAGLIQLLTITDLFNGFITII